MSSAAPCPGARPSYPRGVPLVNLYATVLDKKKSLVPNLDQNNFRIFEDNVEEKISFFSREKTLPLAIGLLIDTSGSEANMIGAEQQAASQFLTKSFTRTTKPSCSRSTPEQMFSPIVLAIVQALERAVHASIGPAARQIEIEAAANTREMERRPRRRRGGRFGGGGPHLYDAIDLLAGSRTPPYAFSNCASKSSSFLTAPTPPITAAPSASSTQQSNPRSAPTRSSRCSSCTAEKKTPISAVAKNLAENTGGQSH